MNLRGHARFRPFPTQLNPIVFWGPALIHLKNQGTKAEYKNSYQSWNFVGRVKLFACQEDETIGHCSQCSQVSQKAFSIRLRNRRI